jgi:tetratricopeptide (TPR) repeat protein
MDLTLLIVLLIMGYSLGKVSNLVGAYFYQNNNYIKAIFCYEIANVLLFYNRNDLMIFYAYANLDNFVEADKILERRRIATGSNKDDDLARMYCFVAYQAYHENNLEKSLCYYHMALSFCETEGVEMTVLAEIMNFFQIIPLTIVLEKGADSPEETLPEMVEVEFEKLPFWEKIFIRQ